MRDDDKVRPTTLAAAAAFFGKPWSTIRDWPSRYDSPRVGKVGRLVYYDMRDLETIDAFKNLGKPIPSHEERMRYRRESAAPRVSAA
ncbi:hypothetical protein IMZ11_02470 [Microtetraspora sp. AC03309]|uniref:hypothetical protein n=1 Tax=Microtetraspora sp. AC03309 TaxID=2779376 RepID=UPI001E50BC12|nr:hypothetical protein [Microtetraspora sp. AC03309]MCC5574503.1 hypothetical protein [Microtetraspora sp. AC03309]